MIIYMKTVSKSKTQNARHIRIQLFSLHSVLNSIKAIILQTKAPGFFQRQNRMNAELRNSGIWKAKWNINGTPIETNLYLYPWYKSRAPIIKTSQGQQFYLPIMLRNYNCNYTADICEGIITLKTSLSNKTKGFDIKQYKTRLSNIFKGFLQIRAAKHQTLPPHIFTSVSFLPH